jgi:Cytochrome b5-like Heme/Steroid binding domain
VISKFLAVGFALVFFSSGSANAHQPVVLLSTDTTAAKGPLLVDGTVSFALRASFAKAGEKKAFRAQFNAGDALSVQYLIVDKKPESSLRTNALPTLLMTSPTGTSLTLKFTERTKFYEPYGKVNYLYLARYKAVAQAGVYSFVITSKGKAGITVAVGEREVRGEVSRGATPTQSASATPTPTPSASSTPSPAASATPIASSTPSASPTPSQSAFVPGFTLAEVKKNNNAANCWAIVDDNVYNLTAWINGHPGGANAILNLCGTDATLAFKAQHENAGRPNQFLGTYKIGPLKE